MKDSRQRQSAADRALIAMAAHGKLVRSNHFYGAWETPEGTRICGSAVIYRLVDAGLVKFGNGGYSATRVLEHDEIRAQLKSLPAAPLIDELKRRLPADARPSYFGALDNLTALLSNEEAS